MPERSIILEPDYVFTFGKHRGKTAEQVVSADPQYIDWLERNKREYRISVEIRDMLSGDYVADPEATEVTMPSFGGTAWPEAEEE